LFGRYERFKQTMGPWKGACGEGQARRGLSVIVSFKIDVNVNENGYPRGKTGRPFAYLTQYGSIC
jgi:hypothetical protein